MHLVRITQAIAASLIERGWQATFVISKNSARDSMCRNRSQAQRAYAHILLTLQALSDEPGDGTGEGTQAERIRAVSDFAPIKERVRKLAPFINSLVYYCY